MDNSYLFVEPCPSMQDYILEKPKSVFQHSWKALRKMSNVPLVSVEAY